MCKKKIKRKILRKNFEKKFEGSQTAVGRSVVGGGWCITFWRMPSKRLKMPFTEF